MLIDGVTLVDNSAIDQWGSNGTIQNCVAHLSPAGGGPTGYGTAILCRDKAKQNVVRFNTLVTGKFSCLTIVGPPSATRWYGNIMQCDSTAVAIVPGSLTPADVAGADFNCYSPAAKIAGKSLKVWQSNGNDLHSITENPAFIDPSNGNFHIRPNSPCAHAASVKIEELPPADADAKCTSTPDTARIGAYEASQH